MKKILIILPTVLLLLNIIDIILTYIGLTYFGATEWNPLFSWWALPLKLAGCVILFIVGYFYDNVKHGTEIFTLLMIPSLLLYTLVDINNLWVIITKTPMLF